MLHGAGVASATAACSLNLLACRRHPRGAGMGAGEQALVARAEQAALALSHPRKTIGAPAFAADAVMHDEQAVRIVLRLHRAEPRAVLAPEGGLPVLLEEIALGEIGAAGLQPAADLVHRPPDRPRLTAGGGHVRLTS